MFVDQFSEVLAGVIASHQHLKLLILGDFNMHVDIENDPYTRTFMDMIAAFDFDQHVHVKTHVCGHTLNLCLLPSNTPLHISPPSDNYFISDHTFVSFTLQVPRPPPVDLKVTFRKVSKIDKGRFKQDLQQMSEVMLQLNGTELAESYDTNLRTILDKHAPQITKTIRVKRRVAWFDSRAKTLKKELRKLEKIWKRTKHPQDLDNFKVAKTTYRKYLKQNKITHFRQVVQDAKGDSKQLFSITMGLMGKDQVNPMPDDRQDGLPAKNRQVFLSSIATPNFNRLKANWGG